MLRSITDMFDNVYATLCGLVLSVLGYFTPMKDIVLLLILFFILDVIFGFWAAKKLRGERFSVKIIWTHTIPRMLLSITLVLGAFMWDDVFKQDIVSIYRVVGWFIAGVLLYSIAENGYHITKWKLFPAIGEIVKGKMVDKTGVDIGEKGDERKDNLEADKEVL